MIAQTTSTLVFLALIASARSAPNRLPNRSTRSTMPSWHLPCGENLELDLSVPINLEDEIRSSLESIRLQHQLTMNDYLNRDYEYLYERVRIGVHEHQYIPNWVPGKKDVNLVRRLENAQSQSIVSYYPKLHMDLQKFAVAFEELVEDESDERIQEALRSTQSYLTMMLCEVESNIVVLPTVRIPSRVERSIMSPLERDPEDDTRRHVRDWGVLLKYRDYLHAWRHVFNY